MLKNTKVRLTLIVVAIVIVLGGGALALTNILSKDDRPAIKASPVSVANQNVDLSPATNNDKKDTEDYKKTLVEGSSSQNGGQITSGKKSVTPIITYAGPRDGKIAVNAYVSGIVEDGGQCSLAFTSGSKAITKVTTGVSDASSTTCPLISASTSELSRGDWTATLTYDSAAAHGESSGKSFTVE